MADGSIIIDILANSEPLQKGLSSLGGIAGTAMKAVTGAIATASTAIIGIGTASTGVGMKFEASMSQVAATMGMSVEEIRNGSESFKLLEDSAKKAGATTQFSASEAGEALNYLALAGYDAQKATTALPKVLDLAAAGGMDLAYASDLVTDSMSALGLQTFQLEGFTDQMAKTAQKSNTSIAQLGEGILTVGGTAKDLAGGTVELNTALGILADNGIKGSEGGTALRNMILALTPTTEKAVGAFDDLNLSAYDNEKNLRPLSETFKDLNTALEPLSQKDKVEMLKNMFNKVDLKSVSALMGATSTSIDILSATLEAAEVPMGNIGMSLEEMAKGFDVTQDKAEFNSKAMNEWGLDSEQAEMLYTSLVSAVSTTGNRWDTLSEQIENSAGATKEMAKVMLDNLKGQITILGSAMEGLGIEIYQSIDTPLKETTTTITGMVDKLANAVKSGGLEGFVEELGTISAQAILQISNSAPQMINVSTNLINSFIRGIQQNLPQIVTATLKIGDALLTGVLQILPMIADLGLKTIEIFLQNMFGTDVSSRFKEFSNSIKEVFTSIANMGKASFETVKQPIENLGILLLDIANVALPLISNGVSFLAENMDIIIPIIGAVVAGISAWQVATELATIAKTAHLAITTALANGTTILTIAQGLATKAQLALNLALSLNPISMVVVAVAALAAGIAFLVLSHKEETTAIDKVIEENNLLIDSTNDLISTNENNLSSIERNIESRMKSKDSIDGEIFASKKLADELFELSKKEVKSAEDRAKMIVLTEELNSLIPDLALEVNAETGELNKQEEAVRDVINANLEMMKVKAAQEDLTRIAKDQYLVEKEIKDLQEQRVLTLAKLSDINNMMTDGEMKSRQETKLLTEEKTKLTESLKGLENQIGSSQQAYDNLNGEFEKTTDYIGEHKAAIMQATEENKKFTESNEKIAEQTPETATAINEGINKIAPNTEKVLQSTTTSLEELPKEVAKVAEESALSLGTGFETAAPEVKTKVSGFNKEIVSEVENLPSQLESVGSMAIEGLWQGMQSKASWLNTKVLEFCQGVVATAKKGFDEHSPSKKFEEIGAFTVLGFNEGIEDQKSSTDDVINDFSKNILELFSVGIEDTKDILQTGYNGISEIVTDAIKAQNEEIYKIQYNAMAEQEQLYQETFKNRTESIENELKAIDQSIKDEARLQKQKENQEALADKKFQMGQTKNKKQRLQYQQEYNRLLYEQTKEADKERQQLLKESLEEELKTIKEADKKRRDAYNDLGKGIIDALKNRYEKEKEIQVTALEDQISRIKESTEKQKEALKSSFESTKELLDKEKEAQIKSIEERLDKVKTASEAEKEARAKSYENAKEMYDRDKENKLASIDSQIEAIKKSAEFEKEARTQNYENAKENIEREKELHIKSIEDEIERIKNATDEKIAEYDREYASKLKLLNEDEYNAVQAIQAEIDAINALTEAEERAEKEKEKQQKISEAQTKVAKAKTPTDKLEAQKALDELLAKYQREELLNKRKEEQEALKQQINDIKQNNTEKKDELKQEYDNYKENIQQQEQADIQAKQQEKQRLEEFYKEKQQQLKNDYDSWIKDIQQREQADIQAKQQEKQRVEQHYKQKQQQLKNDYDNWKKTQDEKEKAAIALLQKEKERVTEEAKLKQDILKKTYDDSIKNLETLEKTKTEALNKEKEAINEHYKQLTSQENLNAEARKMIIKGNNEEIINLLEDYNSDWLNAGKDFADNLIDGLNGKQADVKRAVDNLLSIANKSNNIVTGSNKPKLSSNQKINLETANNLINGFNREIQAVNSRMATGTKQTILQQNMYSPKSNSDENINFQGNINTVINLDGRQVAKSITPFVSKELEFENRGNLN